MTNALYLIALIVSPFLFFIIGFAVRSAYGKSKLTSAENEAERVRLEAVKEAENRRAEIILEGENRILDEKKAIEKENRASQTRLQDREKELNERSRILNEREQKLDEKEQKLDDGRRAQDAREKDLAAREGEMGLKEEGLIAERERIAGLTRDEAKAEIVSLMEEDAKKDASALASKIVDEAKADAARKTQEILVGAMQRMASSAVQDNCVTTVSLPNDEMKGRIIGREGRNIRALETLLGVDIMIDDTPEAVFVSSFNPMRKAIATRVLEILTTDGRIHQARIEDTVAKVTKEIDRVSLEEGEKALMDLGMTLSSREMIRCLGRLYFRRSYGQNVLQHSKETAMLAGMIASELHLNVALARRAALLHDIGKGLESSEVAHAEGGARIAERLGESRQVVNAIRAHHGECEPETLEAVVVQIADAISASRPGARDESVENYIKRLEEIEKIALGFSGVERAYAIQAGRDIRVIVDPKKTNDARAGEIASEIAKRLKAEYRFLGQIRITVTRETKFVETIG